MSRMHTAGHQIIPGSLRRAFDQNRRLNLQEPFFREEVAHQSRHLAAEHQVSLKIRAAQIQEAVLQAKLLLGLAVFFNGEGRRLRLRENSQFFGTDLDFAGLHTFIDGPFPKLYLSHYGNHKFASQSSGFFKALCSHLIFIKYNLKQP